MFAKVIFALFTIHILLSTSFANELPPETINAIKKLACYVDDKTTIENCGGSQISCFGEPSLFDYEALDTSEDYQGCVKALCGINNPNIKDYTDSVTIESEMNLSNVQEQLDPHLDKLYEKVVQLTREGREHLANNPALKEKLDGEKTFSNILMGYRQIFMNSGDGVTPEERTRYAQENYNWSPQLTNSIHQYVIESAAVVDSVDKDALFQSLSNSSDQRRAIMGELERRIRDLPDHSLNKTLLRQKIHALQSASFINKEGNVTYMNEMVSLALNLVLEEFHLVNPRGVMLKNQIIAHAPPEDRQQFEIYPGVEGEKPYFTESCNVNVSTIGILLPTKQKLEEIKAKTEATRQKIIQAVQGKYSRETEQMLIPKILGTNIVLPVSRDEFMARMDGFMQEQVGMMNSFSGAEKVTWASAISNMAGMQMSEVFCSQAVETQPNAFAWSARKDHNHSHDHSDNVSLGAPFANNYEVFGERALAHEFGHIVSFAIQDFGSHHSKRGMKDAKDCLVSNHSGKWFGGMLSFLSGDAKHIRIKEEEDYADLFSFMAVPNKAPKMCGLFDNGISIFEGENHLDVTRTRLHSPTFFRLLHENIFIGNPIPEVCEQELEQLNGRHKLPDIKNCWKPPGRNL